MEPYPGCCHISTYINPYLSQYYWTHAVSVESSYVFESVLGVS